MAAYTPTLPNTWFYRGITGGLSSPIEPLIYATFNTRFTQHTTWLHTHDIHLLHGCALILSKLETLSDASLITTTKSNHDFVWYNKPSRMVYRYTPNEMHRTWWTIEASPLQIKQHTEMISTH